MKIFSIFSSIDGECNSYGQGITTTFVRFSGCNLKCSYCDTESALKTSSGKEMSVQEVMKKIESFGLKKVTITGGEPLMQKNALYELTKVLYRKNYKVSIETNGSIMPYAYGVGCWVVDFKLPSSGMYDRNNTEIFTNQLMANDFVKFIIMDRNDFDTAVREMNYFKECGCKATFAFSPGHGVLDPNTLVQWMLKDNVQGALNVQLHKLLKIKEEK